MISRRLVFSRLLGFIGGGVAVSALPVSAAVAAVPGPQKVVYHLADFDKVGFVLGNISNHIQGKGGADKVQIVLVVHGPALAGFKAASADAEMQRKFNAVHKQGVQFAACGNTMAAQKLSIGDLVPGFEVAEEGGVVRIADLQEQGYIYLKP